MLLVMQLQWQMWYCLIRPRLRLQLQHPVLLLSLLMMQWRLVPHCLAMSQLDWHDNAPDGPDVAAAAASAAASLEANIAETNIVGGKPSTVAAASIAVFAPAASMEAGTAGDADAAAHA